MQRYQIAPSILSADFARLGEEVNAVLAAGADLIHFDVMDNHFVPNLTFGPMVLTALRKFGVEAAIDVHLMVKPVDALIGAFLHAGADAITFHPDASDNVDASLNLIHKAGKKAGLAVNPDVALETLEPYIPQIDILLMMTVFPGFGGQAFKPEVLSKIKQAHTIYQAHFPKLRIYVDGGISEDTIASAAAHGADTFIAGSAIFNSPNYKTTIEHMRQAIKDVIHE